VVFKYRIGIYISIYKKNYKYVCNNLSWRTYLNNAIKKIKVGIIGAGGIANVHARYYREIPNVEIVAVAEIIKERGLEFARRWGIQEDRVFTDYADMIDKVELDAVSVCTPHKYHATPTIYALKKGLHVLVEKPMASSAKEALEMLTTALKYNRILMVGFQTRFDPQIEAARKIVSSGVLGRFYYGEVSNGRRRGIPTSPTFYTKEMAGGGVALDIGCYAVDTSMFILGFPRVERVSAHMYTALGRSREAIVEGSWGPWDVDKFEVEDFFIAKLTLKGGGVLLIKQAWAMHNNDLGRTFFMGTKGGIKLNPLEVYRDEWGYMTTTTLILPNKDPWRDKIGKFIEAVATGKPSPIDPRETAYGQVILDAIYRSAEREGEEIKIQIPEELKGILRDEV